MEKEIIFFAIEEINCLLINYNIKTDIAIDFIISLCFKYIRF